MTVVSLKFAGFNRKKSYNQYFIDLKDETFIFILRWSRYCNSAFVSITDYYDNPIISSKALVNNLKIRNNKIPYTLYFVQQDGKKYEPMLNNIADNFVLMYDDEEILE